jgi:hypothetical protein
MQLEARVEAFHEPRQEGVVSVYVAYVLKPYLFYPAIPQRLVGSLDAAFGGGQVRPRPV